MPDAGIGFPPSRARVVRCLFCGGADAWWACNCLSARLIRDGDGDPKRQLPRPRTVMRDGVPVIILCPELLEAARKAGVIKRELANPVPLPSPKPALANPSGHDSESGAISADKPDNVNLTECVTCHRMFAPRRKTARYCSDACRARGQKKGPK
jgi:hypothetical protein